MNLLKQIHCFLIENWVHLTQDLQIDKRRVLLNEWRGSYVGMGGFFISLGNDKFSNEDLILNFMLRKVMKNTETFLEI
jgi:hypothetical protein